MGELHREIKSVACFVSKLRPSRFLSPIIKKRGEPQNGSQRIPGSGRS